MREAKNIKTNNSFHDRSFMILDQWRKKAQLYRSNVVLVPLGDDFRYDRANEWDNQYQNYEMIIDYINSNDGWNAEVKLFYNSILNIERKAIFYFLI